jgi:hypothetical protein
VVTGTHITWQQNYVNVLMNLTLLLDWLSSFCHVS